MAKTLHARSAFVTGLVAAGDVGRGCAMSAPTNNGGPAFPISDTFHPDYTGMSLRDWFAGQVITKAYQEMKESDFCDYKGSHMRVAAKIAYQLADAMLAARKVTK